MHYSIRLLLVGALAVWPSACSSESRAAELDPVTRAALAAYKKGQATEIAKPEASPRKVRRNRSAPIETRDAAALRGAIAAVPGTMTAGLRTLIEGSGDTVGSPVLVVRHDRKLLIRNQRTRTDVLFERNPLHPWEMEAAAVDHPHKAVIDFVWSDLKHEGMPTSWLALARLGVTDGEFERGFGAPTGAKRTEFGLEFVQHRIDRPADEDGIVEIWWNAERQVPWLIRRRFGPVIERQELRALRFTHEPKRLKHPATRFTIYQRCDLSDFREEHVGCGKRIVGTARGRGR